MADIPLSKEERESQVVELFCKGFAPSDIPDELEKQYKTPVIGRTDAWKILSKAAVQKRFRYVPAIDHQLRDAITAKYKNAGLDRIEIVDSLSLGDLATRTAETLLDLIREHHRNKKIVHIGFAGGGTLLEAAQSLGELLRDPERTRDIPRQLVFHSMVVGWNADEPEQDPNSFSAVMSGNRAAPGFNIRFVGLQAPGIVPLDLYDRLRGLPGIRESFKAVDEIDVIVTSAGRWECQHSDLYRFFSKYSDETRQLLQDRGCVGDLMWSPLGPDGEIDLNDSPIQMFTLMRISQLDEFIRGSEGRNARQVLLALGQCRTCQQPKTEILQTILKLAPHKRFVTHLVCDCRTATRALAD